jgi:hypothetical protein
LAIRIDASARDAPGEIHCERCVPVLCEHDQPTIFDIIIAAAGGVAIAKTSCAPDARREVAVASADPQRKKTAGVCAAM